ncbi:hypothetical protein LTR78_007689 [Recurvomyces mirabilis]|uniref:Uncharacterized protein n=1 Tax=Recurvomyces mirabilis TaxID=574656 RepID=A0AAE0TRB0_9PEZI|nr:hypothetical protein LTR78_007689 [Recurvomyces mirabilis]KAK5151576.1 hypothetical protein LTS14_009063 [Recurvomyces mirabilis]
MTSRCEKYEDFSWVPQYFADADVVMTRHLSSQKQGCGSPSYVISTNGVPTGAVPRIIWHYGLWSTFSKHTRSQGTMVSDRNPRGALESWRNAIRSWEHEQAS